MHIEEKREEVIKLVNAEQGCQSVDREDNGLHIELYVHNDHMDEFLMFMREVRS